MRVLIVDDEELGRMMVREFLRPHPDIDILAECANGYEAVKAITEMQPDLVFLDIQMPKLNGFEVVELAGAKTHYIFCTAFDQYALKAFEIHALDYLLKPYTAERFNQALNHARASLGQSQALPSQLRPSGEGPLNRILIRDGSKVHVIASEKVDFIEAQDDYVQVHSEGKSYLKNQRLSELESQLDPHLFLRIHRSYLLNLSRLARIEQVAKDSHNAILLDGSRLPISRSGYQKLKSM